MGITDDDDNSDSSRLSIPRPEFTVRPLNIFGLNFTKRKKERLGERILFGIPIPNCVVLPENPNYNTGF